MRKFFATLFIGANLFFMPAVNAELQTYTGSGEYLMSDFETFDVAQQRAKQRAEQNACEQAGVYVESCTEVRNAQVTRDEIITMTSGILKIVDVQFKREFVNDNTTRIRATVKANIDTADINKWLAKGAQERAALVEQNEELRRANAEQDKQIAAFKKQLVDIKTQTDRERITQAFAAEEKIFLSNQDLSNQESNFAWKLYNLGDYDGAIIFFTEAIRINPNNDQAYLRRGIIYQRLEKYNQAVSDFKSVIKFSPKNVMAHGGLRDCYQALGDYTNAQKHAEIYEELLGEVREWAKKYWAQHED